MTTKTTKHQNIWAALCAAQAQFSPLKQSGTNPHFKSKYSTLGDCHAAVDKALHENGLVLYQAPTTLGDHMVVRSCLVHTETGDTVEDAIPLPDVQNMQALGSAISYARRYLLMAQLGLAAEDDDGNAAQTPQNKPQQAKKPTKAQTTEKAPQNGAEPATEKDDNPFEDERSSMNADILTDAQLKKLNVVGKKYYEEQLEQDWDEKRPALVEFVSKGAIRSARQLTRAEASKLIDGIEKLLAKELKEKE